MCESWDTQVKNAGEAVNPVIDSIVAKEDGLETRGGIGFALDTLLVESPSPLQALHRVAYTVLGDNPPQKTVGYPDENSALVRDAMKAHDEFAVIDALSARIKEEAPESKELIVSMLAASYFKRVMRAVQPEEDPFAALQALFAAAITGDTSDETDEQDEDEQDEDETDEDEQEEDEEEFRLDFEKLDSEDLEYSGVARL